MTKQEKSLFPKVILQEVWTYISPDGLVRNDPYGYSELYPIEQISEDKRKEVLQAAKAFVFDTPVDEEDEKECVLQLFTTKREAVPRNWFTNNFLDNAIEHPGLRIIDSKGQVYSFGAVMPRKDARELENSVPFTLLSTGAMKVRSCDHEEAFEFEERRVTSVPLTAKKAKEILEFASSVNVNEPRFNFVRQNCVKFATLVLKKAGAQVDARVKVGQFFRTVLPDITTLPVIRQITSFANAVVRKISAFAAPIFAAIKPYIPAPIKQAVQLVSIH